MADAGEWFEEVIADALIGLLLPYLFMICIQACNGFFWSILFVIAAYFAIYFFIVQKSFSKMKLSFLSWLGGNILYLVITQDWFYFLLITGGGLLISYLDNKPDFEFEMPSFFNRR